MPNTALPLACLALAALAAPAAAAKPPKPPEQQLAEITRGAAPGPPQTCIQQFPQLNSQVIPDYGVVYFRGRDAYLNRLGGHCHVSDFDTLITSTPQTQLCRGDIVRVIDRGSQIPRDNCALDEFIPYRRPAARK